MKVTKLIREYVEEQVASVYAPAIKKLEDQQKEEAKEREAAKERISQIVEEAEAKAIMTLETEFPSYITRPTGYHRSKFYNMVCVSSSPEYYNPELEQRISDLKTAKVKAIKSILTDLELGATRKELDEMIAKLLVEGV